MRRASRSNHYRRSERLRGRAPITGYACLQRTAPTCLLTCASALISAGVTYVALVLSRSSRYEPATFFLQRLRIDPHQALPGRAIPYESGAETPFVLGDRSGRWSCIIAHATSICEPPISADKRRHRRPGDNASSALLRSSVSLPPHGRANLALSSLADSPAGATYLSCFTRAHTAKCQVRSYDPPAPTAQGLH